MRDVVSRDGFKDDDDDDDESACYRTTTTSQTSSSIACVDVCVEFPTALTKQKKKENSNRACRSQPYYGKEGEIDSKLKACERACLDAHAASVALKFPDDKEETRRDYGVVAKNECAKRCATSFPKAEEEEEEEQQQQQH